MKVFLALLFICCLSLHSEAQKTPVFNSVKGAVDCGGFIVASVKQDRSLKEQALVYGRVCSCAGRHKAEIAMIFIYDESSRRVDSTRADTNGFFKKLIKPGTYKIWCGQPAYGSIETGFLDFEPQNQVELNLFLSIGPALKN
jgi:hypothetical protein